MSMNSIEVKNLCFSYDGASPVLKDVSLNIEKGGFYSILGPNGSGKTTLLKVIAKLLDASDGSVFIGDQDINGIKTKALSKLMSVVPQQTTVEFDFSVHDIVMMGRAPHKNRFSSETQEDSNIVKQAMEMTSTWELRGKSINAVSGGERQRVIIARALAQQTETILMDEPISHLDIHHQIELLGQMRSINRNEGKTVVAVLHDLNLAAAYSDKIIMMHKGQIHSIGNPEQVLNQKSIEEIYGIRVQIMNEPTNNKPYIVPVL